MTPGPRPPAGAPLAAPVAGREPASPKNTWNCCGPPLRLTRTLESAWGKASLKPQACRSHAYRYDVGQRPSTSCLADKLNWSQLPGKIADRLCKGGSVACASLCARTNEVHSEVKSPSLAYHTEFSVLRSGHRYCYHSAIWFKHDTSFSFVSLRR